MNLAALRSRVSGPVLTPDDPGFAEEVAGWLLTFTHTPAVAVGVASVSDIVEAVKFAAANGLPVRVQGSGHGAHEPVTDGVLISTRRLAAVTIDANEHTATIGAGATWDPVIAAAAEFGLAPITGSSGTVGVVGFLLGGGWSPLVRSHGVASDRVREFEVVLASGEVVRANRNEHPDLFWALRGGKGGFGVVTEVTVELVELPTLYGGSLVFDTPNIEAALQAWVKYTETTNERVSTSVAILRMPDQPFIPEPIRGRTLLSVRFAFPGDAAEGERLAAPLRAAAPVYLDELGVLPAAQIGRIHNDPPNPSVGWSSGRLLGSINPNFVTTLLRFAGPKQNVPFVAIEVRHLGSAAATDVPEGSAVSGRSAGYTLALIGTPSPELFERVIPEAASQLLTDLAPWLAAENTVNFASAFANRGEFERTWPPAIFARLAELRTEYDPSTVFPYGVASAHEN